ncbi:MAG TPA: ATP-binding protein [Streptosporangiaceae bacterium]|nr:ATP-binding protein [Streptosporangiaceae bacterium]
MTVETLPPRLPGPGSVLRWCRSFPGRSAEMRHLRCWLAELLPAGPVREDMQSIAVELATNAVRHTATGSGGQFTVQVSWCGQPGTVRISVADDGAPHGPRWPDGPCPAAESGMGLYLVCALASRTGECGDACGRQVWAEMAVPAGPLDRT